MFTQNKLFFFFSEESASPAKPEEFSGLVPARSEECDCRPTESPELRLGPAWRTDETHMQSSTE